MSRPSAQEVASRIVILKYQVVHAISMPLVPQFRTAYHSWTRDEQRKFAKDLEGRSDALIAAMKSLGLWKAMTEEERTFLRSTPLKVDEQSHLNAMWCSESAAILLWAIGLLKELPPFDSQSPGDALAVVPLENVREFTANTSMIDFELIEKQRNLAELWHWRSRTRELREKGSEAYRDAGYASFDEIIGLAVEAAFENGDIGAPIDRDFPAKGKAYRDLTDTEWSEVQSISIERHRALNWLCGYAPGNRWDETPTDT